jgi:hypothetical protein
VRKYAIESLRETTEQLYINKEVLFDLSNFRRPVEVWRKILLDFVEKYI